MSLKPYAPRILTYYTLSSGSAILRGSLTRLREVVSDLLEILGAHARLLNGNNAVVAFAFHVKSATLRKDPD